MKKVFLVITVFFFPKSISFKEYSGDTGEPDNPCGLAIPN
jgi:hypothetical protein